MAEPLYPLKNTLSGKTIRVPLDSYDEYVSSRDVGSGKFIWEPLSNVPGFRQKANGGEESVMIPKERVRDAAVGGRQISFSISRGSADPRHELSRQEAVADAKREVAKGRNPVEVFLDSGLSVATFGGTSALGNWLAGEGAAEARGASIAFHPMAHLAGRIAGIVGLGAAPVLANAGRAAGIANAGSIFEVSSVLSQGARQMIQGGGFLRDFSRRVVGTMTFGASAEIPLSFALAMADIVDNDKPLTAETIVGETGHQFMWGMGIAAVTGIPMAGIAAGLKTAGRGAMAGASRLGQTDLMHSIVHGGTRYIGRKYLRSTGRGAGDALETLMHRAGTKAVNAATRKQAESGVGRFLSGEATDTFIKEHRNVRTALRNLADADNAKAFEEAARTLSYNVRPGRLADDLHFVADPQNAKRIVEAKHFADRLPQQGLEITSAASQVKLRVPEGARFVSQTKDILEDSLRTAASMERGALQKQLANIELPKNSAKAFKEALELRRRLSDTGKRHVDKALRGVVGKDAAAKMDDILAQVDGFDIFRGAVEDLAPRLAKPQGLRSLGELEDLRAALQGMGGSYRGLYGNKMIQNPKVMRKFFDADDPLTSRLILENEFDDFGRSIEALGRANRAFSELSFDARPLVAARKPMTQEEILESQLETVITAKRRIWETLKFIGLRGGGGRHTIAFTGVMEFRQLQTLAEKQETFAVYRRAIAEHTSSPGALEDLVGRTVENVAGQDMELGVNMAESLATGAYYLAQQMPRSDDPSFGATEFSSAEIENFLEAVGAISDPISVLATASDGSVMSQAVDAIRTVYPNLYAEMVIDIAEYLEENPGEMGHAQLLGLDAFTGGALGYSDGPAPNLTYRVPGYQTAGQAASAGATGGPENRRMDIQQNTTPAQKVGAL